jgi:imidazolonepropionase-like amidohydrolase
VNSPEDARARVDELVERGVDQVKCYAFLDYDCFKAIVDRGHHHNKFVVAHLGKHVNARRAIETGLDEFEHLSGVGEALHAERNAEGSTWDMYRLWASVDIERVNQLLDLIEERGTWVAITRLVWVRLATTWDQRHREHPQMEYVPGPLMRFWETFAPNNPVGRLAKGIRQPSRMDRSQQVAGMSIFTSELFRRDYGKLLIGTDAPFPYLLPGFSYHDELGVLMDCGMSERTALQAATLWGAQALEIEDAVGSIEPGKAADLLLVEGNPLDDIHALEKVNAVVRDGEWLDPAELLAEAGEYARTAQPSQTRRFDAHY